MKYILSQWIMCIAAIHYVTCCGGGRRSSNKGWGVGDGKVHYTFKNGVKVYGTGTLEPSAEIGVEIPFGRKRRAAANDQQKEVCSRCLNIKDFTEYKKRIFDVIQETKTDLVFKAQFEKVIKSNSYVGVDFKVLDVYKTPNENIQSGENFNIKAKLASCQCFPNIGEGLYLISGKRKNGKLVIDSNFIKM